MGQDHYDLVQALKRLAVDLNTNSVSNEDAKQIVIKSVVLIERLAAELLVERRHIQEFYTAQATNQTEIDREFDRVLRESRGL